jgi:hypothetical protein
LPLSLIIGWRATSLGVELAYRIVLHI